MTKRLQLFDLVDDATSIMDLNHSSYQYVEGLIRKTFMNILYDEPYFIEASSRIKSIDSLKEKIIRNKYYLDYTSGQEILDHLPDLIGLTVQCRFLSDEKLAYEHICEHFKTLDDEFSQCLDNTDIYLNTKDSQPKSEMNGYQSYRLDGYCFYNNRKINFELQIKSLTHSFWSDIEHQIIYKNNQFILADDFMKKIMNSIRENLDVVDSQIKYVSEEVLRQDSLQTNIGLSEYNFKIFLAKAINDLYCQKMQDITAIDTDFRKCSEIISQYVFIHSFLRSNYPQQQMLLYYEQLNYLKNAEIGIMDEILINETIVDQDIFIKEIGNYCLSKINNEFDWHAFFVMLFSVQNDFSLEQLVHFVRVIKELYFQPSFYELLAKNLPEEKQEKMAMSFYECVTDVLIAVDSISIIYEENIVMCTDLILTFLKRVLETDKKADQAILFQELQLRIKKIFQ